MTKDPSGAPGAAAAAAARRWVTRGAAETERLGAALAAELAPDGVLLLSGELGSGKTVLVRGLAGALGIDPRQVLSPTFNLIREHRGAGGRLAHLDLYRLAPEETAGLGLDEVFAGGGVKAVEWAERLPWPPPLPRSPSPPTPGAPAAPGAPGVWNEWGVPLVALRLRRLPEAGDEAREVVEINFGIGRKGYEDS